MGGKIETRNNIVISNNDVYLTDNFLNYGDYKSLYLNDSYGGHLSPNGNKFVANIINEKLI